jgi:hypothetical protein
VIGHLGPRVSALLDGQLSTADEERAWEHVHACHLCRDAVEREGWVKTRLASMQFAGATAPSHLKGSLLVRGLLADWSGDIDGDLAGVGAMRSRRHLGVAGISSGAVGAAVMSVLALGASPANAPGAVTGPSGASFGSSLTNVITSVVDRQPQPGTRTVRTPGRSDTPPLVGALRRTLAP